VTILRAKPGFQGNVARGYGNDVNNDEDNSKGPPASCFSVCICAADCFLEWQSEDKEHRSDYPTDCCNEDDVATMVGCCMGEADRQDSEKVAAFIADCLGCSAGLDYNPPEPEMCCYPLGGKDISTHVKCYIWLDWGSLNPPGTPGPSLPPLPRHFDVMAMPYGPFCGDPLALLRSPRPNWPMREPCILYLRWVGSNWVMRDCKYGGYREGTEFGHWTMYMRVSCPINSRHGYGLPPRSGRVTCQKDSRPGDDLKAFENGMLCPSHVGAVGIYGGGGLKPRP